MMNGVEEQERAEQGAPAILLTTPALVKNPSEQNIITKEVAASDKRLESLDLARSPHNNKHNNNNNNNNKDNNSHHSPQALTKVMSSPHHSNKGSPDSEKKSKVRSMFMGLSPFKVSNKTESHGSAKLTSPLVDPAPELPPPSVSTKNNKKDCSIVVKVFEARNLPEARQRRKQAEKNIKAFHRAQKVLLEVSSPNLMNFSDATDPYCLVQVEKLKMRTRTIEKKLNPFWCEEFTFEVQDSAMSKVVLTVVDDKKYAQQGEVIGRLVMPINSFRDQREREQWFPIQAPTSTNKIPQVHVFINYEQATPEKKAMFNFQVLGGRNLGLGVAGAPVPYLDFAWKLKDAPTKEETLFWNDVHTNCYERELAGALEMFTLTLWRYKTSADTEEEEEGAATNSSSPNPSSSSGEKKKLVLGQIGIPPVDLSRPRDYWLCLYGKDAGLGDLRVKIKYTEEVVLSLEQYQDFLDILQEPNLTVVHTLGAVAKPNTREGIAYNLVRVFEKTDKAVFLLNGLNAEEINSTPNPDIIFRGNSLATKTVDQYMKLVGSAYLANVLKALIKKLYISNRSCEVDPSKLDKGEDLKQNWKNLLYWVNLFTDSIFESLPRCPLSFRQVFSGIQQTCMTRFPGDIARFTAVSGFVFLRFFCPAILAPKLFNLAPDHPGIKQTRYLILIAKTLQNLANLVEFGSVKEEFMKNMNEFVVANLENMKGFINKLSTIPESTATTPSPTPLRQEKEKSSSDSGFFVPVDTINLEKELASMYRHVLRHREEMVEYHNNKGDPVGLEMMEKLNRTLNKLEEQVKIANQSEQVSSL